MTDQKRFSGWYGEFGGQFVPETLMAALCNLEHSFLKALQDRSFLQEWKEALHEYAGRPTPLTYAKRASQTLGLELFLKREDLLHTGAHKINNTLGQALLAKRMKKKRIIAETGAGQHGVATATACALYGLSCCVYMGAEDVERQKLNVFRMQALGAEVRPVTSGSQTLKDAMNEALRDWVTYVANTHYIIGSVAGPHPYPLIVRTFQKVLGEEAKRQFLKATGTLPDLCIACVGGGSNAMGLFAPFVKEPVALVGVEAAGRGLHTPNHAATLSRGREGILHGSLSYLLQSEEGQVLPTHSVAAGLDYPGVGPEHSCLKSSGRAQYVAATDSQAIEGFYFLAEKEGILPALEPAHAIGYLLHHRKKWQKKQVLLCLSGRGDKDVEQVQSLQSQRVKKRSPSHPVDPSKRSRTIKVC